MHNRRLYIESIINYIDSPVIKIIKGIRRCGKSELLKLVMKELVHRGIKEQQIIYINYESMASDKYVEYMALYEYIASVSTKINGKLYIFLDEIQEVKMWEKAIRSMRVDFDCDLYITGSNANLLSQELATLLSGRYVEFELYPLSFGEFLDFYKFKFNESDRDTAFNHYLRFGGFPELTQMNQKEQVLDNYLKGIYNSVILNDVIERNNIRNSELLKRIFTFIMDNIGQMTSGANILNYLTGANNEKVSTTSLYHYIDGLEQAMIVYSAKPYDIKGKRIMKRSEKFYMADLGLRHALMGYREDDIAQVLENVIFLELKRRNYSVYVGKEGNREVDFVAIRGSDTVYIQVTYLLATEEVVTREYKSLENIKDNYPKFVLSMDRLPFGNRNGIRWVNIIDFILGEYV